MMPKCTEWGMGRWLHETQKGLRKALRLVHKIKKEREGTQEKKKKDRQMIGLAWTKIDAEP